TTSALIVRLEIVLVIIYSYLFLSERMSALAWVGAALLIGGMLAAMDVSVQQLVLQLGGLAALLISALGIASNSIIIKLHLGRVRNELTSLANAGIQSVVFALLLLVTGQFVALPKLLSNPHTLALALVGGLFIPLMLVPYYFAMKRIPMWSCRLLGLITPVAAIVADFFWLHAPITVGQLVGLALVTGGAALVIVSGVGPVQARQPG
ncbi:MAG: DMT family transporter, partial [Armatimonadetes bacterium]|nr:DMT family transporter [Armatimonadota bacterium]